MYNCIYDDSTVIALEQGPCQDTLPSGAQLVDAVSEGTEITVTTEPPSNMGLVLGLGFIALLLFGGFHVR